MCVCVCARARVRVCAHASLVLCAGVRNLLVDSCVDELEQMPHTTLGRIRERHAKLFQKGRHTRSCSRKFRQGRDCDGPYDVCPVPADKPDACRSRMHQLSLTC